MDTTPVRPGDILAGKYRVERVLGMGGMGVVVAATHLDLLEPRALKFMLPAALGDAESVERFLREARAASRLKNEHVAKVHDVGRLENGAPYMVMEYLEGSDLDALVKQGGPLPPTVAALYAIQACEALAEAHALGIIHRDLKPSNLFLTRRHDGGPCVKVLDFGISKVMGGAAEFDMTKTNMVLGSPNYMSPEQMRSARSVDPRTDVWSLGIILYRLSTGKLPFRGTNITELITLVLEASFAPPSSIRPDIPPALEAIILRCLRRDREERFASVAELAAALVPIAPPGAAMAVESMFRTLAASTASRLPSQSFSISQPLLTGSPVSSREGPTPAPRSGPTGTLPISALTPPGAMPAPPISGPADPTGSSWAKTSQRTRTRPAVPILLAVGGAAVLAAVVGAVFLHRSSPPSSATTAEVVTSVPSSEASPPPAPAPSAPPVAPSSVAPGPVVTVAPPVPTEAPVVKAPVPSATPSVSPAPVKTTTPVVLKSPPPRPTAASSDLKDPFGNGRK